MRGRSPLSVLPPLALALALAAACSVPAIPDSVATEAGRSALSDRVRALERDIATLSTSSRALEAEVDARVTFAAAEPLRDALRVARTELGRLERRVSRERALVNDLLERVEAHREAVGGNAGDADALRLAAWLGAEQIALEDAEAALLPVSGRLLELRDRLAGEQEGPERRRPAPARKLGAPPEVAPAPDAPDRIRIVPPLPKDRRRPAPRQDPYFPPAATADICRAGR